MLVCQFGRYRYKQLLLGAASAGDMFKRKIEKILNELPNVFGTADDILVVGYKVNVRTMMKHYGRCYRYADRLI